MEPRTKSEATRFGVVGCPGCNPTALPSGDIPKDVQCAWCWDEEDASNRRWVLSKIAEKWAEEHGMPADDIVTSPETRGALAHPPALADTERPPDTEPGPGERK